MAQAGPDPDFEICTSVRYDAMLPRAQAAEGTFSPSPFYMLEYHLDRMLDAGAHFKFPRPPALRDVAALRAHLESATRAWQAETRTPEAQPLKVREPPPPAVAATARTACEGQKG